MFYLLTCTTIRRPIYKCLRTNKLFSQTVRQQYSKKTHYEILDLKPNCTAEDIRNSFVKLSKENHPDTSANSRQNSDNFRAIVEAYKVLGKADSRASYDAGINLYNRPYGVYDFTEQSRSVPPSNYYGVFGKERISNKRIVLYCMLFMLAGIIVQTLAIRYSLTFRREKLDKMSAKAAKMHSLARANAVEFGNDYQLEKFAQKCAENARSK